MNHWFLHQVSIASCMLLLIGCADKQVSSGNGQDAFVDSLLSTLSIEDKVGEMTQLTLGAIAIGEPYDLQEPQHLDSVKVQNALVKYRVGSILNCGNHEHAPGYPMTWRQRLFEFQ